MSPQLLRVLRIVLLLLTDIHPSQRRHHRDYQLSNDYQQWILLQQIKKRSKNLRQHHHHRHHFHHRLRKTWTGTAMTATAATGAAMTGT